MGGKESMPAMGEWVHGRAPLAGAAAILAILIAVLIVVSVLHG